MSDAIGEFTSATTLGLPPGLPLWPFSNNGGGQLPESFRQAIEEAFGDCGGDLVDSLAAQRKEFCAGR
jgi:hypothetical protein